jgi:hypothetical protein
MLDPKLARRGQVAHDAILGLARRAHEAPAGERVARARAVEPERVRGVAVEVNERGLGVDPTRELAVLQRWPGARARRVRLRTVGADGRGRVLRGDLVALRLAVGYRRRPSPAVGLRICGARGRARQPEEVGDQPIAMLGADGLGVELYAPLRPIAMAQPHHDTVGRMRDGLEARGQRRADHQRVVTNGLEALGDPVEQAHAGMQDRARAPVDRLGRGLHSTAIRDRQALVPQAHAEHRYGQREHVAAAAEVARAARVPGPRRDHDRVELHRRELGGGHLVVAHHERLAAADAGELLEQVPGVRVVVVEQQDAWRLTAIACVRDGSGGGGMLERHLGRDSSPRRRCCEWGTAMAAA